MELIQVMLTACWRNQDGTDTGYADCLLEGSGWN